MRVRVLAFVTAIVLIRLLPISAHHSFSTDYLISAPINLKGELISVEWVNPHAFLTLAVKGTNGAIQEWHVEGGALSVLSEAGWTVEMLRHMVDVHETIVLTGYRARKDPLPDSSREVHGAWVKVIELADGRKLPFN